MLAMNYRGPYRVRVEEKPMPVVLHPEDAIIRVTRSCICGSDLHLYHGMMPDTRVGMTFGHEFCGIVEEVGPDVRNLQVGDHVLVLFTIACGKCHFCQQGLFGNCHESNAQATAVGGIFGYSHTAGGYDGGQAQYVRVPYAGTIECQRLWAELGLLERLDPLSEDYQDKLGHIEGAVTHHIYSGEST